MSFANGRNFRRPLRLIVFKVGFGESADRRMSDILPAISRPPKPIGGDDQSKRHFQGFTLLASRVNPISGQNVRGVGSYPQEVARDRISSLCLCASVVKIERPFRPGLISPIETNRRLVR